MSHRVIDLETWPRAPLYRMFRSYARPHFATTVRLDVTHLITRRKPEGISPFRACLYAIGAGIRAVPELSLRFQGDELRQYTQVEMSSTVPAKDGGFTFSYLPIIADFETFDRTAHARLKAAQEAGFNANMGARDDLVYLSCMPWIDYTSINNALPGPEDCIPRVSWGKFVASGTRWEMAMTIEVHHALVDGAHVGAYFEGVQHALSHL